MRKSGEAGRTLFGAPYYPRRPTQRGKERKERQKGKVFLSDLGSLAFLARFRKGWDGGRILSVGVVQNGLRRIAVSRYFVS
jgi:hypothetical protein